MKPIINRRASKRMASFYRNNAARGRVLKSQRESEQKKPVQTKDKGENASC